MRRKHIPSITIPGERVQVGEDYYGDPIYEIVEKTIPVISVAPAITAEVNGIAHYSSDEMDVFSDEPLPLSASDSITFQDEVFQVQGNVKHFKNYLTGRDLFQLRIKKAGGVR